MRRIGDGYTRQTRRSYALRLLKAAALHLAGNPRLYGRLISLGANFQDALGRAARSFPADGTVDELLTAIRRRPSAPLLALLARRLERFDYAALAARTFAGDGLSSRLGPGIVRPGRGAISPTHWLFPVLVEDPDRLVRDLRRGGFDASRATSSIAALRSPDECPRADGAASIMERIVFLPAYPSLPEAALDGLAAAVDRIAAPSTRKVCS